MAMPLGARGAQWFANMTEAAMGQPVDPWLLSEYRSAPVNSYSSLPPERFGTTEAFATYTENGYAQHLRDGFPARQEPELNFAMTEPVQLHLPTGEELAAIHTEWALVNPEYEDAEGSDGADAEGVEDDDVEEVEDDNIGVGENQNTTEEPNIDSGFQKQMEGQPAVQAQPTQQRQPTSQPQQVPQRQQKISIRKSAWNRQAKQAAETKKRDSKSPTIKRKRPGTTTIDELAKQHEGGTPPERAKFDAGYTEPKTFSSPVPLAKGQKRYTSATEDLEKEHGDQRPHKKVKVHSESVPKPSPESKLPKQKQKQKQKQKPQPVKSIQEQAQLASSPLPASNPVPRPHRFSVQITDRTVTLYESLKIPGLHVLPELEKKGEVTPWTANHLTLLYIHGYIQDNIQLCDLITDVWIRAFQERNRSKSLPQMWMPNKSHVERDLKIVKKNKQHHMKEYHRIGLPDVPKWQHKLPLPTLSNNVTDFDPKLLNALYHHTAEGNGARMLWADALALCGTRAEDWFLACKKEGIELHPDLVFNVMCATLRSCRRRLTLKIEEVEQDKWCRRYHLHSKWGLECHRPTADEDDEDEQYARLQAAVSAHAASNSGDGEVDDDLGADILQEFNNQVEERGDNDLYHPPTPIPKAATVEVVGSDGDDSSEED
ncbi:hypothetical protein PSPO01_11397 [Paraphaeosphaeria sporulosa]